MSPSSEAQVCSNCQSSNPNGQRFCGHCGNSLDPPAETLRSLVDERVKRELDARLKDQKVVAVEIAESVYERVSKWAKIFVVLLTLPLGAALYFVYGQYASLSDLVKNSRSEAQRILAGATAQAHVVEGTVEAANKKTQELAMLLENRAKSLTELDSKVGIAQNQMQEYEVRISKTGKEALGQVESVKQTSDTALKEIGQLREKVNAQQKELSETGALLKDLASRSILEGFKTGASEDNFVVVTRTTRSHTICMRLTKTPYTQTVRVQWNIAVQPPDSYFTIGNVVVLPYWEDSAERFSERSIFVSYIADANPPQQTPFIKKLAVKDGIVYGDGNVFLPLFPPRPR